jgi:hypothetical protein
VATTHTCSRCKARLYRAPDGHWVNDLEDVICEYPVPGGGIAKVFTHDPVESTSNGKTDVDELIESMVVITATDDGGVIGGHKTREDTIALFYVSGNHARTAYLGTGHWAGVGTSPSQPWRVEGAGDWADVVLTGMRVTEAVGLLYTAYQLNLVTTTTEQD